MGDNKICPFKNISVVTLPENYCQAKGSYCIWPCEYILCDTYKKVSREMDMLDKLRGNNEKN